MSLDDRALRNDRDAIFMRRLYDTLLFLAIPVYLFLILFTLHGVPYHIVSDEGLFVLDGLRMGAGRWIYRDFFQFNAPGIDYVFFFAFKIFGVRAWVPNLVTLLIGTALSWLTLHLSRRIMSRLWSDLITVIFVVFVYGRWLDATHHWVSLFATLLAIRLLLTDRSPSRMAMAGALIGFATFFTQTAGAAAWAAFAIALFYKNESASRDAMFRRQASLFSSAALTWSLLSASTIWHAGWRALWFYQVTFPQRYELRMDKSPIRVFLSVFPHALSFLDLENVVFYLLMLSVPCVTLCILLWKRQQNQIGQLPDDMPIFLLAAFGLLLMAEVITRPTWIRLYASFLPSLILLFVALSHASPRRPRISRLLIAALWSVTILSGIRQTMLNRATYSTIAVLPAGRIALRPQEAEECNFLARLTHPGESFFQAYAVSLYFPLELSSPVYMDYLRMSSLTRPEFLLDAIQALDKYHVHYITLRPASDRITNPAGSHYLDPLYIWVGSHYRHIHDFSNNEELWELKR